jgi:hypothetical protein
MISWITTQDRVTTPVHTTLNAVIGSISGDEAWRSRYRTASMSSMLVVSNKPRLFETSVWYSFYVEKGLEYLPLRWPVYWTASGT